MTREEIIARLLELEPGLKAKGVRHMRMFGSRARGDNEPDSDLDLLIDVDPQADFSLLDLADLHAGLSEEFGIETNVLSSGGMKRRFAKEIEHDLVPVF
jgi:uncharacterized protein